MKGLELSERYYREICAPMLEARFPGFAGRIAAGLVGEGSECLGFDDAVSRDHDWGAGVCLWLNRSDYEAFGLSLRRAFDALPPSFVAYPVRKVDGRGTERTGVLEIDRFYFKYTGLERPPACLTDWLAVSESSLATATNGKVFTDPLGEFSTFRDALLAFYPEDVRRKKLAARCAVIAQAGQYNFPRCAARKEYVAASLAEAACVDAACSAAFLLNKRYKPFYKWTHRALLGLPVLGEALYARLAALVAVTGEVERAVAAKTTLIEEISVLIRSELERQELSTVQGDFLLDHAFAVQDGIQDARIRTMDVFWG